MAESVGDIVEKQRLSDEIDPDMAQLSRLPRFWRTVFHWVERQNLKYSKVGNPPVFDNAVFPWAAEIEREWQAIRAELDRLLVRKNELPGFHEIAKDVETISTDRNWRSFLICAYGHKSKQAIRTCPETWRVVQKIPGLKSAMFSIFEPGKHLSTHRGPYNGVLRFHLGLIVPKTGDIGIRVSDQVCRWEEGRALIFDDAYRHEAWNHSDQVRVVLFVDFAKPERFPGNVINWVVLRVAQWTPFIREGYVAHKKWERLFFGTGNKTGKDM
jgi:ornithine lipid ester-linked acyl 2-hydroxylase